MSATPVEEGVCEGGVPVEKMNGKEDSEGTSPAPDSTTQAESATSEDPPTPAEDTTPAPKDISPVPQAVKPKYRYDWYQTEADVCINILIKKVKKENVQVNFQEKSVS